MRQAIDPRGRAAGTGRSALSVREEPQRPRPDSTLTRSGRQHADGESSSEAGPDISPVLVWYRRSAGFCDLSHIRFAVRVTFSLRCGLVLHSGGGLSN